VAVDGDAVVVVQGNQLAEAPVAGQGARLGGDALHVAAVTHDAVAEGSGSGRVGVVRQREPGPGGWASGAWQLLAPMLPSQPPGALRAKPARTHV
jgi:hypothetical protein